LISPVGWSRPLRVKSTRLETSTPFSRHRFGWNSNQPKNGSFPPSNRGCWFEYNNLRMG